MLSVGALAPAFTVQPVFGLPVSTGGRPLIVLFLRSLSGSIARAVVPRVHAVLPRVEAAGGTVVAFTRCDLTLARDFVPREHVLFPVVVESDPRRFEAWGVGRDAGLRRSALALLTPGGIAAASAVLGSGRARPDGGVDQLAAGFRLDADGRIEEAWYGRTIWELPDLESLCSPFGR